MPYVVKDTKITSTGKSTRIQLDQHHPTQNYETWNIFYKHSPDAPAPQPGMTIECTPEANDDDWYWIDDWKPVQSNGGPKHISAAIPNNIPQTLNQEATLTNPALEKEASMFVMGTVGRACMGLGGDMFPSQQKLTEMVRTTKRAYLNGMTNDSGS